MHLAENVMHFARVLRGAGIPVGPDRVIDALRALALTGIENRDDFYWTLASVFLDRREQFDLFDQAFAAFWRDPRLLERLMALKLPTAEDPQARKPSSRIADPLAIPARAGPAAEREREEDARFAFSARERLRKADFDTMTTQELAQARTLIASLRLPIPEARTRRLHPDPRGARIDLRATLRASVRGGTDLLPLRRCAVQRRHPPLVILCDISGSMSRYARMLLHFVHAITNDRDRVHTFLFGTRLTNVTRQLRHRDVDVALAGIAQAVEDWSGGTRISSALHEFNLRWSRRVLGQNAAVLLITDGLDRDEHGGLGEETARLRRACRRLLWLNPLLRFEGFEPRAAGMRAMLPHVDALLPAHNVDSLAGLTQALSGSHQFPGVNAWR